MTRSPGSRTDTDQPQPFESWRRPMMTHDDPCKHLKTSRLVQCHGWNLEASQSTYKEAFCELLFGTTNLCHQPPQIWSFHLFSYHHRGHSGSRYLLGNVGISVYSNVFFALLQSQSYLKKYQSKRISISSHWIWHRPTSNTISLPCS